MTTAILGGAIATLIASLSALFFRSQRDAARRDAEKYKSEAASQAARATLAESKGVEQAARIVSLADTYRTQIKRLEEMVAKCTDPEVLRAQLEDMFK